MSDLLNLKTQFEVRYTPILNFQEVYRRILSPYLRIAKFNIFNQNQINEYIVLQFEEDSYHIDCRFDRMVFVSEGVREDLKKSSGPLFIYFEILEQIKQSSSFGKINNALLAEFNLRTLELTNKELLANFSQKFLTESASFNLADFPEKDYKLSIDFKNNDNELKYEFGPFHYEKDVFNYNLNAVTRKDIAFFKDLVGIAISSTYFEPLSDPQFSTYKSFSKILNENSTRIYL